MLDFFSKIQGSQLGQLAVQSISLTPQLFCVAQLI